jgi:6-pyruvoyltetrahydropterin/6-carboxytetrahydropterin synthase
MNTRNNVPVRIAKAGFSFEACHSLAENYVGPCSRMHGHSYKLSVEVEGVPDPDTGMVMDFKVLKKMVNENIIDKVDHQNLNEIMPEQFSLPGNTTCEKMIVAFWWALDHDLMDMGVKLVKLKLWETEDSHAGLTREMVYSASI